MKLTEQEQAAVSRGMIEGLLRALHAEGVLPPERLELVLELLCAAGVDMISNEYNTDSLTAQQPRVRERVNRISGKA